MVFYWILYFLIAVWVFFDAKKRGNQFIGWSIGCFLGGPLVLPFYLAKRYLKTGQVREGGTGWNVMKYFALFWTITMIIVGIAGMAGAGQVVNDASNEYEQAGAVIGAGIGMAMLVVIWFVPMVVALILGLFLKKSSIVEKGPTGKFAQSNSISA
ncbi:hypothetical protein [Paenibacillus terrigena]|uniref:hypothetical protein n=1 Tax=Paenibacillus terrigena TaxID=369333 RepID=UPI0028D1275C|nr:hypothetical protein [Paenibacillus terrigena]